MKDKKKNGGVKRWCLSLPESSGRIRIDCDSEKDRQCIFVKKWMRHSINPAEDGNEELRSTRAKLR